MFLIREECVICDNSKLIKINSIKYPKYDVHNNNSENIVFDIVYGYCETCYSIQLMSLLKAEDIYNNN
jgi:hypothetical protein